MTIFFGPDFLFVKEDFVALLDDSAMTFEDIGGFDDGFAEVPSLLLPPSGLCENRQFSPYLQCPLENWWHGFLLCPFSLLLFCEFLLDVARALF